MTGLRFKMYHFFKRTTPILKFKISKKTLPPALESPQGEILKSQSAFLNSIISVRQLSKEEQARLSFQLHEYKPR